jgi:ribose 5-phosphate isomerase B
MERLRALGHEVIDHGAHVKEPWDDYPGFCIAAAIAVTADAGSLGIVIGGSGNGEQIAANKVVGIRAALCWNLETAQLARRHNDANVLAIGARMHDQDAALAIAVAFVSEPFSDDPRHAKRIEQVMAYETGTHGG